MALSTAALCIPPMVAAITARETHRVPTERLGERGTENVAKREAVSA